MNLFRAGTFRNIAFASFLILMSIPAIGWAQDFVLFKSDEYGFTMKYPATWVKIDKPQGNYYVVFQAPELTDNFRSRIHVAAHSPVKDSLDVFKQELKQGIADMQKTAGSNKQTIQILDEGDFKCDVPGAYFFFVQAYEEKLKMWMDIVIVFYKHEDTLVRISCLAPSQSMEKFHALFNDVLVSVKFSQPSAPPQAQAPSPPQSGQVAPVPSGQSPAPQQPQVPASQAAPQQPQPAAQPPVSAPQLQQPPTTTTPGPGAAPTQPIQPTRPAPTTTQPQPGQSAPAGPAPTPGPRGPARTPERPPTGIVN